MVSFLKFKSLRKWPFKNLLYTAFMLDFSLIDEYGAGISILASCEVILLCYKLLRGFFLNRHV